jgi:anti-sigma regulatory factor (Ser/Thr protein kinase)
LPIVDRLRDAGVLSEGCALRLKLAVQEAVVNGFEHGNLELSSSWKEQLGEDGEDRFSAVRRERLNDPLYSERRLHIRSRYDGASIEFVIRDEGRGFPAGSGEFREGLIPAGDLACSGRGLALMSSAVDLMRFAHNGAEVTLIKYLPFHGGA